MKTSHVEVEETPVAPEIACEASELLKKCGVYYVWGEILAGSLKEIHQDILLKHYQGPKNFNSPLQLIINSGGGSADEAFSLIDLLANVRFKVGTAGFGTCASAASMLLACGTKGLRMIAPNATICVHQYSWGTMGNHADLVAHRRAQDIEHGKDIDFWIKHSRYTTRKDVEKYLLKNEDNFFDAKEAVKHGIVDKIGGALR